MSEAHVEKETTEHVHEGSAKDMSVEDFFEKVLQQTVSVSNKLTVTEQEEKRLWGHANRAVQAGLVKPRSGENFDAVVARAFCSMIYGLELGISWMQALSNVSVVNQRPSLMNKIKLGLCLRKAKFDKRPSLQKINFDHIRDKDRASQVKAVWKCVRDGEPYEGEFSMQDARDASLFPAKDEAAWQKYPKDQLVMRALGRLLDFACADILMGADSTESLQDLTGGEATMEAELPPALSLDTSPPVSIEEKTKIVAKEKRAVVESMEFDTSPSGGEKLTAKDIEKIIEETPDGGVETYPDVDPVEIWTEPQKVQKPVVEEIVINPQSQKDLDALDEILERKALEARWYNLRGELGDDEARKLQLKLRIKFLPGIIELDALRVLNKEAESVLGRNEL